MTGGNPLHLAQAARSGTSHVTAENAIAGAIGRLGPNVQRILAFAALLGVDGTAGEVATLVGTTQATVVQALTSSGLLQQGHDGLRFHDLVREAALALFDHASLLDAHADAAKLLSGSTGRMAHHAFAAAQRSTADAEFAITACRNAASSLRRGYAYEQAAVLLDRAVDLDERVHTLASRAELLIERADAVLACGRLTDARSAYEVGAEAAELSGDPVLLARAVLGLGGIWVHQYRNETVRKRVLAQQRAALRALPEHERGLRCLLQVRLAAEAYYEGGSVQAVLDALTETRASGDEHALAEALSLTHHAMLAPEHAVERMALAEEQIVAASAAGDGMLALVGLLWLTADRYLLGDPDAERSLTELRQQSAALGVATTAYLVTCMDVMHLIRAGRLADAEDAAGACLQRGVDVGDADAPGYYGAQLLTIRWFQGRVGELAELVMNTLASTDLAKPEYGFRASAVLILARDGRLTEARATLAPLLDIGLANLQSTSSWLTAMVGLIEAAAVLEDPALAKQAADLVRPFAEMPVMPSLATSCFGAASRGIGVAELTMGNAQRAVTYLEQAVLDNLRLGHRPAHALSRAQLAEALVVRGRPGDLTRARELLYEAADDARKMDMSQRADAWQVQAADLVPPDVPVLLRRESTGWTVHIGQAEIALPEMVGLHYLSLLLERPGQDIPAFELSGQAILETRQDLLDDPAVAAFRARVRELDSAINAADSNADLAAAERLRLERDALTGSLDLGSVRGFPDTPERARTSVRKALKRALDVIASSDPVLGEELRTGISTGYVCRFTPVGPLFRQWRVERP
jgi:tetratricopeptide (TPR) repeat protein